MNEALLTYIHTTDVWVYKHEGKTTYFYRPMTGSLAEIIIDYLGIPTGADIRLEWLRETPTHLSVIIRW